MFKKNDIHSLPFAKIPEAIKARLDEDNGELGRANVVGEVCSKFIEAYELANKFNWVLPQMQAHFGSWKAVKDDSGLYNGLLTVKENCVNDDFNKGLWFIAQRPRSGLISGQGVRLYAQGDYNNLVPLILSSFKIYQNIPYSKWNREGLSSIVDHDLYEAMICGAPLLSPEEVMWARDHGLRVQTGSKKGQMRSPVTTSMLYGLTKSTEPAVYELAELPKLAIVMLAQIWCAHPSNRTNKMVLDPTDWDSMPEPAISSEVFTSTPTQKKVKNTAPDDMWDWTK